MRSEIVRLGKVVEFGGDRAVAVAASRHKDINDGTCEALAIVGCARRHAGGLDQCRARAGLSGEDGADHRAARRRRACRHLARTVAQQMAATSGQTVVVENRPGGAGAIGGEAAARSPADGYTLFLGGQGSNATLPHLAKINFDPGKDFVPVIHLATFPNLLVVNPALPVKTVKELVAHAKANPGKLSFASQGNGSSGHMVAEQFKMIAGIDMVHVPYRGAAPAVQDLVAGHVQVMFDSVTLQMPQLIAGKSRALAVMSERRVDRAAGHTRP